MLLIVAGPHGYVSPSWYAPGATPAPTWNFSVAHCYGVPQVLEAEENLRVLTRLVAHFEQHVDDPGLARPGDRARGSRAGRSASGCRSRRFICKVKMSQDKDEVSQRQVLAELRGDGPYAQPALAARHGTRAWRRVTSTTTPAGASATRERRRTDPRIAAYVHAALGDARTVLNVGAGAGSYEPEDRYVVAVEPSAAMRAQRSTPAVIGVAEALPFDDDASTRRWPRSRSTSGVTRREACAELRRVARTVVILTFDPAAIPAWWLGEYVPEMLAGEAARYPALETLGGEVTPVPIPLDCSDGFIEAFYGRPEALLDPEVRRSQSAWAFGAHARGARAARRGPGVGRVGRAPRPPAHAAVLRRLAAARRRALKSVFTQTGCFGRRLALSRPAARSHDSWGKEAVTRRATGCRCWSILLALGLALLWAPSAHAADAFTQISASASGWSRTCGRQVRRHRSSAGAANRASTGRRTRARSRRSAPAATTSARSSPTTR